MSPELIHPELFGFETSQPTESSDCFALGMVIYETVSGHLPFHNHGSVPALMKVLGGERPPRGERFTESLWEMLGQCWRYQPNDRPSIEDVLQCLEVASPLWKPHSPEADEEMEKDGDNWDSSNGYSGVSNRVMSTERSTN